ncbi:hypothetical protein ASPCADRAFT_206147, partial [Aspergillus carbonarius ITEM 5010]
MEISTIPNYVVDAGESFEGISNPSTPGRKDAESHARFNLSSTSLFTMTLYIIQGGLDGS